MISITSSEFMKLLTHAARRALPGIGATESQGLSTLARVKLFTPDSSWTWYVTEFDGEDLLFGLVDGFEAELGYFSLSELTQLRGPLGLPVERDRFFEPRPVGEIRSWRNR